MIKGKVLGLSLIGAVLLTTGCSNVHAEEALSQSAEKTFEHLREHTYEPADVQFSDVGVVTVNFVSTQPKEGCSEYIGLPDASYFGEYVDCEVEGLQILTSFVDRLILDETTGQVYAVTRKDEIFGGVDGLLVPLQPEEGETFEDMVDFYVGWEIAFATFSDLSDPENVVYEWVLSVSYD